MEAPNPSPIVLVHDWLTGMRGGEKCLEAACRRWPEAPLFTLLHHRGSVSSAIEDRPVRTSWLQSFPQVHRYYRYLLPLMPAAAASWRLPHCDLVLSFSHCVAKAVRPPRDAVHVCYCFTPMRYAWHMRDAYFSPPPFPPPASGEGWVGGLSLEIRNCFLKWLRDWDRRTAARVSHFVAISRTVQQRIWECYGRASEVIYPPVDTDFFCPEPITRQGFYLVVSAFAPYKRVDLAIEACNRLKRELLIIGKGQAERQLRALAGPTIHFLGWQPDAVVRDHLRRCRALLFPGEEDFGIVPLEAQACGTPVLAFGRGGATETISPPESGREPTGLFFAEQTVECLADALQLFERRSPEFSPQAARRQALRFNQHRFAEELFEYLDKVLQRTRDVDRRAA
jgi:glycosyltransferase involved in cell wall biosynthesis